MKYTNKYIMLIFVFGIILLLFGIILFFAAAFAQESFSGKMFFVFFAVLSFAPLLDLLHKRRRAFSSFHFDERGVTNKCFACKDILITWNECVEIGIAKMARGYGLYNYCLYFSKEALTEKQIIWIQNVKNNSQHLWIMYNEEILDEVLKYVDRSRIKNLHTINNKSHRIQFPILPK